MSKAKQTYTKCVNCFLYAKSMKSYAVKDLPHEQVELLKEWVPERSYLNAKICGECHQHLVKSIASNNRERKLGFKSVCKPCGKSILRAVRKPTKVNMETPLGVILFSMIEYKITSTEETFCSTCVDRGTRKLRKIYEESQMQNDSETDQTPVTNIEEENNIEMEVPIETENQIASNNKTQKTIELPITKILSTPIEQCLVQECQNYNINDLITVPQDIRFELFLKHKILLYANCNICHHHVREFPHDKIFDHPDLSNRLTAEQIEEALSLVKQKNSIDFSNVFTMNGTVCRFWTGMDVKEFMEIHNAVDWDIKDSKQALAMLLIKLRNKLSFSRMAYLFKISPSDIVKYIEDASRCLQKADCT